MTSVQWLFHYLEVQTFEEEKISSQLEIIKALTNLYNSNTECLAETMINAAKLTGTMINPEAGKVLLEAEKIKEARADIGDDEFADFWKEFSSRIPGELKVEDAGMNVDLEGDAINLEKLYEIEMEERRKKYEKE